ncbi:MAG: ribbon-helix-helix protein, CopG family [Actinomycetota bacterium]|nr:ribbon-helix-helix protein, CopG family [Actinomycetota bacterium]
MRRIQIHIDEDLDRAAAAEAERRGLSKAALIRAALETELDGARPAPDDPWEAMIGRFGDGAVDDIDAVIYEQP